MCVPFLATGAPIPHIGVFSIYMYPSFTFRDNGVIWSLDARNIPNKQFYIIFYRLELCYILTIPSYQRSGTSKANIGT